MSRHGLLREIARAAGIGTLAASVFVVVGPVAVGSARPTASATTSRAAAPATAATVTFDDIATPVRTTNGVRWDLVVSWTENEGINATLNVGLQRTVGKTYELHNWSFPTTVSTLNFTGGSSGTLDSGTQASPVASIDLNFKTTSKVPQKCASGSEITYNGTVSGKVLLVMGLKGGGTVGGTSLHFRLTTPRILEDFACIPPVNQCVGEVVFTAGSLKPGSVLIAGGQETVFDKTFDYVGLSRTTSLKAPKGANRTDVALLEGRSASYDAATKVLSVTTASSGLVTGSATLSGGKVTTLSSACTYKGQHYTTTTNFDETATYEGSIKAKTLLAGTLRAPTSGAGRYEVETATKL